MSLSKEIQALMAELDIRPKKSLGQNFLVSENVIQKIVQAVSDLGPKKLIEIGPGLGSLTRDLLKLNLPMSLIELDQKLAEYWKQQQLEVFEEDALRWNWGDLTEPSQCVLVSNLPYQISSSLVIDRSMDDHSLLGMVLMFQKEVAQRMRAKQGQESYGMLSVIAQSFWDIEFLLEASSRDFIPAPQVASRVLVFRTCSSPVKNKKGYLKFVKACFLHPRKLMISNLVEGLGLKKDDLLQVFSQYGIESKTRAEELKTVEFIELYKKMGFH